MGGEGPENDWLKRLDTQKGNESLLGPVCAPAGGGQKCSFPTFKYLGSFKGFVHTHCAITSPLHRLTDQMTSPSNRIKNLFLLHK